jgi:hypothetical protein
MSLARERRPAFRPGELLVMAVIGGVVVGLMASSLQRARLGAARVQCVNNSKQLALAVHNYASAYQNAIPPLTSDMANGKDDPYNGSLFFTLIPYLEADGGLWISVVSTLPSSTWYAPIMPDTVPPHSPLPPGQADRPLCSLSVSVFRCAADATIVNGMSANQTGEQSSAPPFCYPWAASSYAANYQVFGTENDLGSARTGNFCGPKYNIGNVPDGTANTVFFGEQFAACGSNAGDLWAYPGIGNYFGSHYTTVPEAHAPVGIGDSIVNTPESTNSKLWASVFGNSHQTCGFTAGGLKGSIFEHNRTAPAFGRLEEPYAFGRHWDAPPQTDILQSQCDKSRLQGSHKGVTVVTMGDGSVRVLHGNVSQATWYAAIMPADGNPLGPDW